MSNDEVAIAIPAYEAAPSIADIVRRSLVQLDEVLVVDDGSTDATLLEARAAGARILRHPSNVGKGVALRHAFDDLFGRGFRAVVTIDADGQHLPEEVPRLLEAWQAGTDLVIGSREHLFAAMSAVRRTSNRWSSHLISLAAGEPVADVQCGFRLYTRDLILSTGFPEARFEAESAVVVRAVRKGFRIRTVPVELGFADGRLTSHYRPVVDSLRIFWAVCRARLGRLETD
ncbi:MAG: glycosyltransferase family 2 protein [Thermoanaerobaculia bacterium]|nr:glycosyltransferase family 2 protein [Thermoanaerobaculia bacterium]